MKKALLATALLMTLFSCKKETEKNILGKYKITGLVFQSKGNADQDLLATFPDCAKDDLLIFESEYFKTEDAGISCDEKEQAQGAWSIKGNNVTIDGVRSEIVSFDQHTLILATPMSFADINGTVVETLEKQ